VSLSGCNLLMGGNELVHIGFVGPFHWVTDGARFSRPVTISGLQARERAFSTEGKGECTVEVNTRSPVAISFSAWNPKDRNGGSAVKRCRVARGVAEVVVRRFVPLAGGTPWSRTPQRPGASAGEGKHACEIVGKTSAVYGGMDPENAIRGTDPLGTTCVYKDKSSTLAVLVAAGPDATLSKVGPRLAGAAVSDRRLGELPARLEDGGTACALSVEFVPGRTFTVTYQLGILGMACKYAEVVAADALSSLINASTG
jgi:hypothetical protein